MNYLIFGAGAIGTYFGGSLINGGDKVVFIDIPQVAAKLQDAIIQVESADSVIQTNEFDIYSSLEEALDSHTFDAALFALKSFDTETALKNMQGLYDRLPPFLCLQNGVENETILAKYLGQNKVIHGTVTTAISKTGLGSIRVEKLRGVGVSTNHPLSESVLNSFEKAGLKPSGYAHPLSLKWSKMLTNLLSNASSAILDMTASQIFGNKALFELEIEQIREALQVMDALNIPVCSLPGTPVKALAWAVKHLPPVLSQPILQQAVGKGRGDKMPSFHIDLHSGRGKIEVDYLNGAVVRFGMENDLNTPVNQKFNQLLLELNDGILPKDHFRHNPEKLLAEF